LNHCKEVLLVNDKTYVSWNTVDQAIDKLVKEYRRMDYRCDVVYGLPRGGLPLAVMLSHRLELPVILTEPTKDQKVLIVDDIADTGAQLNKYKEFKNAIIFTIFYHKQSIVIPDKWIYRKYDKWIIYPWEVSNENN